MTDQKPDDAQEDEQPATVEIIEPEDDEQEMTIAWPGQAEELDKGAP